jgi:hypothetical protein
MAQIGSHGFGGRQVLAQLGASLASVTRPTLPPPPPFEVRLAETRQALARLQVRLAEQCPGEHRYVPHDDDRPPWCPHCGYLDLGLRRSEYGTGKLKTD